MNTDSSAHTESSEHTKSSTHIESSTHHADGSKHRMVKPVLFAIFSVIWFVGLLLVVRAESQVPSYMLIVATVFFFMLVPSMVELVQDFDRFVARFGDRPGRSAGEPAAEQKD